MNKILDELMSINWHPECSDTDDGVIITVPALDDFGVCADVEDEAWADYPDALRSHLAGYVTVNKIVPVPFKIEVAEGGGEVEDGQSRNVFGFDAHTGMKYETTIM